MCGNDQLCWFCEKACGGCSWSKSFKPVEGWNATPTEIISYTTSESGGRKKHYMESYKIEECPEYELLQVIKENFGRYGYDTKAIKIAVEKHRKLEEKRSK